MALNFSLRGQKGFSLLEVMLSLGFLMTIIIGVTEMLKSSFDMKAGLSQKARVLHHWPLQ